MIMHDYNKEGKKIVLLLHPMLANGRMMYDLIGQHLGNDVRCLAPDFKSHGEEVHLEYNNADYEAEKINDYLLSNNIRHIDLGYGASLGGVVLTQLIKYLKKSDITFGRLFFEGTSFFENAKFLTKIVGSKFVKKHNRAAADRDRAIIIMGQLYGKERGEEFADQFISMSEESIKNIAKSCGDNKHGELTKEEQRRCVFAYGSKDFNVLVAKRKCKKYYPEAKYITWAGYDHCEKITADKDEYARMIKDYLNSPLD